MNLVTKRSPTRGWRWVVLSITISWLGSTGLEALELSKETRPTLRLVEAEEPGEPLRLEVTVRTATGEPAPSRQWTVYQTDARGYYQQDASGRELGGGHARLKGTVTPDREGRFEVETIRPAAYPGGGVPVHIHFTSGDGNGRSQTLHFSDDPNLPARLREAAPGRPLCSPSQADDGVLSCRVELILAH